MTKGGIKNVEGSLLKLKFKHHKTNNEQVVLISCTPLRFPVAIKNAHDTDAEKTKLFLDEAKTMLHIGEYHDHIVNLQGIAYQANEKEDQLSEVR